MLRLPRRTRAVAKPRPVRLELDLPHETLRPSSLPVLRQLTAFLREQEVEEQGSLLLHAAELLDELGRLGYRRVDHWEIDPGGWLPLPEAGHAGPVEPVAHLVRALRNPAWGAFARARSFAVRLSSEDGRRIDAELLHLHRERQHSITLELWDAPGPAEVRRLARALRDRLAPLRVRLRR